MGHGYCDRCGTYADLDQAAMCGTCRAAWRPSAPAAADLGASGPRGGGGKPARGRDRVSHPS